MRRPSTLALPLALAGCSPGEPDPIDPLDAELIRELSMAQGDASGSAHAGTWSVRFEQDSCDCPSLTINGEPVDLCELGALALADETPLEFSEGGGVLAITTGPGSPFGVLTGAIASDGSFDVASRHDASTLVGALETLTRIDGSFDAGGGEVSGWAGQRLIGAPLGDAIDCRQVGSFTGSR